MRVLMSGGGTAGHVYPALTVAEHLVAEGHEVAFVGTPQGLEARLVPEAGVPFHAIRSRGFDRGDPVTLLTGGVRAAVSVVTAVRLLGRVRPDVVLGFGGYVSLPVGMAAVLRGTPLVCHEQNSVPGLANRVLGRWARAVAVTYDSSIARLPRPERAVVTGNPVRTSVLDASRARGREALGLEPDAVVLLVFGGSRGARHLNQAIVAIGERLARVPALQVVHVAGRMEAASVTAAVRDALGDAPWYRVVEYLDGMGDALAAADLVVARAGATSIAEITALGRATVLVPYPYATDDHQTGNARALAEAGGALVFADAEIDGPGFGEAVEALLRDPERRAAMADASGRLGRPDATARVAGLALETVCRKEMR